MVKFRSLMQLDPEDVGVISIDSWGLKKLFSYGLRRWLVGSLRPRVIWPEVQIFVSMMGSYHKSFYRT